MGNSRNTGFINNIIKYDANGNVNIVSGSTTLLYISSSGAITTTGVISGSNALSASYAATASFVTLAQTASFVTTAQTASFVTTAQTASFVTTAQTASFVANAQSASNAVTAQTASFANTFTVASTLTAQTLVVQTITSSVVYSSGSNIFGNNIANTQILTGSVSVTGSLAVVTNGTEFQVGATGVTLGNALTDIHNVTGSLRVTGSITSQGGFILGNSQAISPTGSIGYNNAVGVFIYGKSGSEADFRLYNSAGLTAMSVVAGTQNVLFNGNIQSKVVDIAAGTSAAFSFGIDHQSTFAFGSTNGRRVAILRNSAVDDNGLQFGYDTTDKTGIIAGSATTAGAGIDFYTYNGSAWGNRMRITNSGSVGIGNFGGFNPSSDLELRNSNATLYDQTSDSGQDGTGVTLTIRNNDTSVTGSFSQVNMQVSGDAGRALGRIVTIRMASATSDMAFVTENANTKAEKMRITAAGNVGIGTTNPLTKVHIVGSSGSDLIRFDGSVNTKFLFKVTGGTDDPFTLRRNHPSGGDLDIMSWTYTGKVGIGLTTPSATFHNKGSFITENSNSRYYGEAKTFIFQSAFSNPTISLITINSTSSYGAIMIRVTVYQNTVSTSRSNIHVGYANWAADPYPTVNKGIIAPTVIAQFNGCTNVGTLAWSGNTLQYTANRHTNYDGYTIVVEWGANIDHNAAPTYGGELQ